MVGEDLRHVVCNGNVKLVERAALEEGAGALERWEIIQGMHIEEVSVGVRVGQIVSGDISQRREALVDVVLAGVVDDVLCHLLLISKHTLVVEECCEVAINHLGMVPHPNGKATSC